MNKSETAMEIARSNKISTVKPAYCRNVEFDDFSFRINDKGLPERCDTPVQTEEDKTEQLRQLIFKAMFGTTQMKKADLAKKLAEILNKHQKTGTRRINEAVAAGILTEQPDGSVSLTPDDNPEEEDLLPF